MNAEEVIWFIEEEENAIIVVYRDGHEEKIMAQGNTDLECQKDLKEKKENIKNIMEAQAYNYAFSSKNEKYINERKAIIEQESNKKIEHNQFTMLLLSGAIALGLHSQAIVSLIAGMSFGSVAYTTAKRKILLKRLEKEQEDIEKCKYFFEFKDIIEGIEIETQKGEKKGSFSIFNLDGIELMELKKAVILIQQLNEFLESEVHKEASQEIKKILKFEKKRR